MVNSFYGLTYFCGKRNKKCIFQEACLAGGPGCSTRELRNKIERYTVNLLCIISFVIKPLHKNLHVLKRSVSKIHAIIDARSATLCDALLQYYNIHSKTVYNCRGFFKYQCLNTSLSFFVVHWIFLANAVIAILYLFKARFYTVHVFSYN